MTLYRVRLTGRNIVRLINGNRELEGFVTTRVIDADTPDHAAEEALDLIYQESELRDPLNGPDDPCPVVLVDEVAELSTFDLR